MDSDDFLMKNALTYIINLLMDKDVFIVGVEYRQIPESAHFEKIKTDTADIKFSYKESNDWWSCNTVWRAITRRKLIEENHIRFNQKMKYGEDTLFQYYVYLYSDDPYHIMIQEPIYGYRIRENSAMGNKSIDAINKHVEDLVEMGRIYKRELEGGKIKDLIKLDNTLKRFSLSIQGALTIFPDSNIEKKQFMENLIQEKLFPYPNTLWNIPNIRGQKAKLKELIKIPFICKWYYDFYYLLRKKLKTR